MGLRIILVSVVAGLGLTLPTAERVGEWEGAARAWINARIAERDARAVMEEEFYLVDPEPPPVASQAPATAPVIVAETVKAPAVSRDEVDVDLDVLTVFDEACDFDFAALAVVQAAPISDAAFDAAQNEFVSVFVAERAAAVAADVIAAASVIPAQVPTTPNPDAAFDAAQEEFVAGFVAEREVVASAEKLAAARAAEVARNEPAEVVEDVYSGLAYALNRGAEGLEPLPAAPTEVVGEARPSDRDGRLTHAVRLTREAVHAWANLLHGPAIVTIGR